MSKHNPFQILVGDIYREIENAQLPETAVARLRPRIEALEEAALLELELALKEYKAGSEVPKHPAKNKYSREIKPNVWVDVYDVLRAFPTDCPAMDHAAKKVLAAGKRGHKDTITDKQDIIDSVKRSMEQDAEWSE